MHQQPWQDQYTVVSQPMLHPADKHLRGHAPGGLFGGRLARAKTGRYVMIMLGGGVRSIDQRWARGHDETINEPAGT